VEEPPIIPPRILIGRILISRSFWPAISLLWAYSPPRYPGQSARVLVILAVSGGSPRAMRMGKLTRVPPPAMELIDPARNPAINSMIACIHRYPPLTNRIFLLTITQNEFVNYYYVCTLYLKK